MNVIRTLTAAAGMLLAGMAVAQEPEPGSNVEAVVAWEIDAACSRGPGTLDPAGLIEADLTGDGRTDIVIDHAAIRCDGGEPSGYCRRDQCTFRVYVQRGDRLFASAIQRGRDLRLDADRVLHWTDRSGELRTMNWNGSRFD